jgi:hypothetical protein
LAPSAATLLLKHALQVIFGPEFLSVRDHRPKETLGNIF